MNVVFQKDENNNSILKNDSISTLKDNTISDSGSSSLPHSYIEQMGEIVISSITSMNPTPNLVNNNINNSVLNEQNILFTSFNNGQIDNNNSAILFSSRKRNYDFSLNNDSKDSYFSYNNNNNNNNNYNNKNIINENSFKTYHNSMNDIDNSEDKKESELIKEESLNISDIKGEKFKKEFKNKISKKIKEGYIPLFVRSKIKTAFYYVRKDSKFLSVVELYNISINNINTNEFKYNFYYKNELIDVNKSIEELDIKPLSIIEDKIN